MKQGSLDIRVGDKKVQNYLGDIRNSYFLRDPSKSLLFGIEQAPSVIITLLYKELSKAITKLNGNFKVDVGVNTVDFNDTIGLDGCQVSAKKRDNFSNPGLGR